MNRTKKPLPTRPFFARFLEQQQLREVAGGTGIILPTGTIVTTLKYPSDNDEGGFEPPP